MKVYAIIPSICNELCNYTFKSAIISPESWGITLDRVRLRYWKAGKGNGKNQAISTGGIDEAVLYRSTVPGEFG